MNSQQAINLLNGLEQRLDDYCELNNEGKAAFRMAITALELFGNAEQLPSAQPEIIHCCECQHWKQGELVDKCGLLDCYADADCYCAWAVRERRQDEQTD